MIFYYGAKVSNFHQPHTIFHIFLLTRTFCTQHNAIRSWQQSQKQAIPKKSYVKKTSKYCNFVPNDVILQGR